MIRDEGGGFILGFTSAIGQATITTAELKAITAGLELICARGFTRILVDSDSLTAVNMIQKGYPNLHPYFQLV